MGMLESMKRKWNKATMSPGQQRLYNLTSRTMALNSETREVTFTVPEDAISADLPKVKRQFELENAWPVKFVDALAPKGIDVAYVRGELKKILATTVAELQAIRETATRDIKADLAGIYPFAKGPG